MSRIVQSFINLFLFLCEILFTHPIIPLSNEALYSYFHILLIWNFNRTPNNFSLERSTTSLSNDDLFRPNHPSCLDHRFLSMRLLLFCVLERSREFSLSWYNSGPKLLSYTYLGSENSSCAFNVKIWIPSLILLVKTGSS